MTNYGRLKSKENVCSTCGKKYHPWASYPDSKYCSKQCFQKRNRTKGTQMTWIERKMRNDSYKEDSSYQFQMEYIDSYQYRYWKLDDLGNPIGEGEIESVGA